MRISLNWLKDYVDYGALTPQEIATNLTSLGLEVETIENLDKTKGDLLVGQIKTAVKHPGADSLQLCEVDVGRGDLLKIICGAKNARAGLKVVVAMIGAELPGGLKIKQAKIRGEPSFGMLCSEEELGLASSSDGIIELDADAPLGESAPIYMGLNDTILTLGVTPNRPDCLGVIGVARELAAKLQLPLQEPDPAMAPFTEGLDSHDYVKLDVQVPEDAGRFVALYAKGTKTVASPAWLRRRLEAAGMRAVNLVVDVTNYVMLEYSHPIHAYDERQVAGGTLGVRRAQAGETLVTLDGVERRLSQQDLVIFDAKHAIGLAGIMGGQHTEIQQDTSNIIIEVAHFNSRLIRKTSKRLTLHTEASHRFERGADIDRALVVAQRVGELLLRCYGELAAAAGTKCTVQVAAIANDYYPHPLSHTRIAMRVSRVRHFIADIISAEDCIALLERLGIAFVDKTEDRLLFQIPSWRLDLEREVDLIEEVARLRGYNRIPYRLPQMEIGPNHENPFIRFVDDIKLAQAEIGYTEIISFPFVAARDLDHLRLAADHPLRASVFLANPLSEDESILNPCLTINLLKAVQRNRRVGDHGVRLFEVARSYLELKDRPVPASYNYWRHANTFGKHMNARACEDDRPIERNLLGGILDQPFYAKGWRRQEERTTFFHAKGHVETLLIGYGARDLGYQRPEAEDLPWLHPGASAIITVGALAVGYLGELHPQTAVAYDFSPDKVPVLFEIDLDLLASALAQTADYHSVINKFPGSTRDLALLVKDSISHADVVKALGSFKGKQNLVDVQLFDVYKGANIPAGKKSVAYNFTFQAADRTLTDKDVDQEVQAILTCLQSTLGAEQR